MEWDHDIDLSKRKFTSRLIVERALARNWRICGFKTNPAIFLVYPEGRSDPVKIFSASPPQISYPAAKISKDKYITNQILGSFHLPVPRELILEPVDGALTVNNDLQDFLAHQKKIVIKPLDSAHGKGITMNVTNEAQLGEAVKVAASPNNRTIIAQEQIEGIDLRIICINYTFVEAISRVPASVTGDGTHSVAELIHRTNASDERGENYAKNLNVIPLDKAEAYLGSEELATIPGENEVVQVIGVSNLGMGGVRHNLKHDVPDTLIDLACQVAKILELPVCAIDFMVRRLPKKDDHMADLAPKIIEVNECPSLSMYDDIHSPEQNTVIDQYLDFVASIDNSR